jgi:SAM-dependent methyltransferase
MSDDLRLIDGAERDRLILAILKRIDADRPIYANDAEWERGWAEQLIEFRAHPAEDALIPKFIRPGMPVRWRQQFYHPADPLHELNYVRMVQEHLGDLMLGCESIHEFGCGTGFNLIALAKRHPQALLYGYDFSRSACSLTEAAAQHFGYRINAEVFSMAMSVPLRPKLGAGAGVFTFGSIEQLGPQGFQNFIDYLIEQRPAIVVHIEPVPELLDPANLVDHLSLMFHRKRQYTYGLLGYLHERVRVTEVERSWFGSTMIESYAQIVWKPK